LQLELQLQLNWQLATKLATANWGTANSQSSALLRHDCCNSLRLGDGNHGEV